MRYFLKHPLLGDQEYINVTQLKSIFYTSYQNLPEGGFLWAYSVDDKEEKTTLMYYRQELNYTLQMDFLLNVINFDEVALSWFKNPEQIKWIKKARNQYQKNNITDEKLKCFLDVFPLERVAQNHVMS